jgi:putative membrane protein
MKSLSESDRTRLKAAIDDAQSRTRARFALVIVPASDRYAAVPIVAAALLALVTLGVLAIFDARLSLRLGFLITAPIFVVAALVFEWMPLRLLLAPRHTRHIRAQSLAAREFAVHVLSHREAAGGVLFFVSLGESYAEVLADREIHKEVGEAEWQAIVAAFIAQAKAGRLLDGLLEATRKISAVLEKHRPK